MPPCRQYSQTRFFSLFPKAPRVGVLQDRPYRQLKLQQEAEKGKG